MQRSDLRQYLNIRNHELPHFIRPEEDGYDVDAVHDLGTLDPSHSNFSRFVLDPPSGSISQI